MDDFSHQASQSGKAASEIRQACVAVTMYGWMFDERVSEAGGKLFGVLLLYAGNDGLAFPSIQTLADRFKISKDTIRRTTKHLMSLGMIQVSSRYREDGGQSTNVYTLWNHSVAPWDEAAKYIRKDS